ncbi:MAG: hypothetical protein EXX96DRAFT_588607, partial [Benjaminiella poitrasii]
MLSAWIRAEIINRDFQLFTSSSEEARKKKNFSWMRNYLEKKNTYASYISINRHALKEEYESFIAYIHCF